MTPPHWHKQVHVELRAGCPLISTVGEPGIHGAVVTGMHGCGVSVPMAAAVAAATCGIGRRRAHAEGRDGGHRLAVLDGGGERTAGLDRRALRDHRERARSEAERARQSRPGGDLDRHVESSAASRTAAARGAGPVVGATVVAREGKRRAAPGDAPRPQYRAAEPTAGVSNVVGAGHRSGDELHRRRSGLGPAARDRWRSAPIPPPSRRPCTGATTSVIVGDAALARGDVHPDRLVVEFKRQFGESAPSSSATTFVTPEELESALGSWVVRPGL